MTTVASAVPVADRAADRRWAAGVMLATLAAVLLSWPFVDAAYNDDWSYAFTVRDLLATGRLRYNGWASASLIAQAYWGLAWVKLFGFSYTVLRVSTVPLAVAAVGLIYAVVRRAGLRPAFAGFAALLVGWSPVFLPVAGTFMTDAPGLCVTFAALYAMVRAVAAVSPAAAVGWLAAGMAVGGVGGTGRQIVWVVPLVVGPAAAWARRRDRAVVVAAAVAWVAVLAAAVLTVRWFNRQPLTIPEPSPLADVVSAVGKPAHYVGTVAGLGLTAAWLTLPALWPLARAAVRSPGRAVALAVILAVVAAGLYARHVGQVRNLIAHGDAVNPDDPAGALWPYALAPWSRNTLDPRGVMGNSEAGGGTRPVSLPMTARAASSALVFAAVAAAGVVAAAAVRAGGGRRLVRRAIVIFTRPGGVRFTTAALAVFAAAYLSLLLPRAARDMVFDRYLLPLMPVLVVPVLRLAQRQGDRRPPAAAWALLAVYGAYAVATTRDVSALAAAREAAGRQLVAAGIPRTAIHGGFEYDAVTQLTERGRINDPRVHPRWAYKRRTGPTPAVAARYALQVSPPAEGMRPAGDPVGYWSPLPPFRRYVYPSQYVDPWWTDPARAATRPTLTIRYGLPDAALPSDYDAPDTPVPPGQPDDR